MMIWRAAAYCGFVSIYSEKAKRSLAHTSNGGLVEADHD
jgi:hypothetical protein